MPVTGARFISCLDAESSRGLLAPIAPLYERWPYPEVPLLATVPTGNLWQIHAAYLHHLAGLPCPARPRIWIAGCGTFQPYAFAQANPEAEILASDRSQASLKQAERRLWLHGLKNVQLAQIDLCDDAQLPKEQFDHIECYGVLMSLPDPVAALKRLAARLRPGGILRLMVYPHFGRVRINQLMRMAQICGYNATEDSHPRRFRSLIQRLPKDHPLRYTFQHYLDAKTDAGLVDGFFHPSTRCYSATELGAIGHQAGLVPAACFHRPWGDPHQMQTALDLQALSSWQVLDYVDAWQELRSNLIILFKKEEEIAPETPRIHPLFDLQNPALPWRWRLQLRLGGLWGLKVEDRLGEERHWRISGQSLRALWAGEAHRLRLENLPSMPFYTQPPVHDPTLTTAPLWVGPRVPSPMYSHHLTAFQYLRRQGVMRSVEMQLAAWEAHASPLEDSQCPFGLSPFASYARHSNEISERGWERCAQVQDFSMLKLPDESSRLSDVRRWLADAPRQDQEVAELRELWLLWEGYRSFFIHLEPL